MGSIYLAGGESLNEREVNLQFALGSRKVERAIGSLRNWAYAELLLLYERFNNDNDKYKYVICLFPDLRAVRVDIDAFVDRELIVDLHVLAALDLDSPSR